MVAVVSARYGTCCGFAQAFASREAVLRGGPWILQRPEAQSVHWSAAGLPASTTVHVTITGASYHLEYDGTTDPDGMFAGTFGGTAPSGEYSISVSAGGLTATARMTT